MAGFFPNVPDFLIQALDVGLGVRQLIERIQTALFDRRPLERIVAGRELCPEAVHAILQGRGNELGPLLGFGRVAVIRSRQHASSRSGLPVSVSAGVVSGGAAVGKGGSVSIG